MVNSRHIDDYFVLDGKPITSLDAWKIRREELKNAFQRHQYGFRPEHITPSIRVSDGPLSFASKVRWDEVYFTFERGNKSHTVKANLLLPKGKDKVPMFLDISFLREVPHKYLPLEEIIDNGFGVFSFCYEDVTTDNGDFENGLAGLFEGDYGKLSLWSYMASICMDYLSTRDEVDKDNVAIIGHSRLGKTALLTSALDERFILTCSNESGCCGAAISREKPSDAEALSDIIGTFPFWFIRSFSSDASVLPFDQHMLLALIAPRYVMIGAAIEDVWADNEGQLLSCQLASKAWGYYGKGGLSADLDSGEVAFYTRGGSHFLSREDWQRYMKKFKEIIKR